MSRRKITDGLHKRADGRWERKEKINGKTRWFSSMDPAEVWKKRDAAIALAPKEKAEKTAGPLFNEVADVYEDVVRNMPHGTQKAYLPAIRRARRQFGGMRIKNVEPYEISAFLKSLSNMAHTTVSNQKTVLNGIFRAWINSPAWKGNSNPSRLVQVPRGLKKRKRQPPTEDQIRIVKQHYKDPDALPAVVFLCTGERRGEACAIRIKDIDFENGNIRIERHVEYINNRPHMLDGAKTDAGVREIPLLKMLRDALEPMRGLPQDTYILSGTNQPLTASQYSRRWAAFWRKYGMAHAVVRVKKRTLKNGKKVEIRQTDWVADVCAHQFRHEYVCMLAMAGVSEEIAIQVVGHANANMIHEVYMSLKPQMVDDTRDKLDMFLKGTPTKTPT